MKVSPACLLSVLLLSAPALAFSQMPEQAPHSTPATQGEAPASKPLLSPAATVDVRLNGKQIIVDYGSPSMRGRKVMGGLVPYGQVWRTGANPATSFTTEGDLMIGKLRVPAGKYTLYTLPAAPGTPWMLIINKQTGQWGTVYKQDQDLGRAAMHSGPLPVPQESLSITFQNTTMQQTELHVKWESTDEWVEIRAVP